MMLTLPLGGETARERLDAVKRNLDKIKNTPEAWINYRMNEIGSKTQPFSISSQIAKTALLKSSAYFTNVPGPQTPVLVCGKPVSAISFYLGATSLFIATISYNGTSKGSRIWL